MLDMSPRKGRHIFSSTEHFSNYKMKLTNKSQIETRKIFCSKILENTFVDRITGCLVWKGSKDNAGNGICCFNGKSKRVHRVMMLLSGTDISGKRVSHFCGNPSCCNVDHMILGSHKPLSKNKIIKPLYASRVKVSKQRLETARVRNSYR